MTPTPKSMPTLPERKLYSRTHSLATDDDIVISGMSGKFPNSQNIDELSYNLYNKIDTVDDREHRWRHVNAEIPRRMGKLGRLDKFDARFFGVHYKIGHTIDPQCRILVETAYEAVIDAGVNPNTLKGSNTGVYMGACFSESEKVWYYEKISAGGYGIVGCARAMLANRISIVMELNGPSLLIDTACSSSMTAIDVAFSALKNGEIDAALVGGANLILHPYLTLQFTRLGVLARNGYCRPFDIDACGYTRSEAICVVFLQKAKDAKRIYSTLLYSKINSDGYKTEGITYPAGAVQEKLLTEFYEELNMNPSLIDYVEAHSTGTFVGDPEECQSLENVFCKERTTALPVGSIKSNIGHTESTSGVCSIVKVHLAFETQLIAPNINFTQNRPGIKPLEKGTLKVCNEITRLAGPLVAINSFGFGGSNAHILLKQNSKIKKNNGLPDDDLPRLVFWTGRTEQSVHSIFNEFHMRTLDIEYCALLNGIHTDKIAGNNYRGYALYQQQGEKNTIEICRSIEYYIDSKYPIAWIFSGLGTEWTYMGKELYQLSTFQNTLQRCHDMLIPFDVNLINLITSDNSKITHNILDTFLSIVTVQVCFVDILRQLNVIPDYIIGHSIGELTCAYADGITTVEETILATYILSAAITNVTHTAVIGIAQIYLKKMIPSTIQIIHFDNENGTSIINGPKKDVAAFLTQLKDQGVFIDDIFREHLFNEFNIINYLNKIFSRKYRNPKSKWLIQRNSGKNSSVPISDQNNHKNYTNGVNNTTNINVFTDAAYSLKLLQQNCQRLPVKALTIEIAPSGIFQEIFNTWFPSGNHLTLTDKHHKNSLISLLKSLGDLFVFGLDIPINNIYPMVRFPVSRGTRIISPLIKWDHSENWYVTKFDLLRTSRSAERKVKITMADEDFEFISGHVIDGRCLFPATAYLQLVWETLALIEGPIFFDIDVEYHDIRFLRATALSKGQIIELIIRNHLGTGHFEIAEGTTALVTGSIKKLVKYIPFKKLPSMPTTNFPILTGKDFYKELRLRGYHYNNAFRAVQTARSDGLYGQVKWELNNWVTFMDCMLQVCILGKDSRSLALPTRIQKFTINSKKHMELVTRLNPENPVFDVFCNRNLNTIISGGIEIIGLTTNTIGRRKPPGFPVLESYKFIPYLPTPRLDVTNAVRVCVQLALENNPILKVKVLEMNLNGMEPIIPYFRDALGDLPLVISELSLITTEEFTSEKITVTSGQLSDFTNLAFIISSDPQISFSSKRVEEQEASMHGKGYLVLRSDIYHYFNDIPAPFQLICEIPMESEKLSLFQRSRRNTALSPAVINVSDNDTSYEWVEKYKIIMKDKPVILYSQNERYSGLLGLVNCIRKEPDGRHTVCFFIDDEKAPVFNIDNVFYRNQLKLGLAINIYRNGKWGSYRHVQLKPDPESKPRDEHCFANILQKGDLSTLCWLQGPIDVKRQENLITVQYTALNFRDVMLGSGRVSVELFIQERLFQECYLGFEFAGINKENQKVMGIVMSGALATHVIPSDFLTWIVPKSWTLQNAVTCPIIYLTVYVAFFKFTKITKGKSILIHAGSGGVGLAAIRIALAYEMIVYTTVSNDTKKKFVMEQFPKIQESHIGNSRDCSFETMIKLKTNGKGVDYVLNSLSDDKLHASVRCLGRGGTFLEIGKFDQSNDTKIGMYPLMKTINFRTIHVDTLFTCKSTDGNYFTEIMDKDLKSGIIQPIPSTVFNVNDVEKSFRYLSTGKHVGKVIIKIRDDPYGKSNPIHVSPRTYFDPNLVYIIIGGLGGFGLELVDWLVIRGARKIILSSKRGITKMYQLYRIRIWESYYCKILINTADVTNYQGCLDLFIAALEAGPIGGIFNLAVILKDAIMENQTVASFVECMGPKAIATKYLDKLSRKFCPQLKHFVIFSSVSCGRGNAGQPNYGMANSVMERIIEERAELELPAKAIQWGAVGEVGLVADMAEDKIDMEIGGTLQQRISSCLHELDVLLLTPDPIVACMVVAEKRPGSGGSGNLLECVLNIMGIRDIKSISMTTTLSEVGMDSLMAVEIKQTLEREFEIYLTPQDLRSLTFAKLKEFTDARAKDTLENVKKPNKEINVEAGLYVLVKNLGDENDSKETLKSLTTLNTSDKYNSCILIVPGIEGVATSAWYSLAANIKLPAFVLQLTDSADKESIPDITEAVSQVALDVFAKKEIFNLIGYSYGGFITMEIARLLENAGMVGNVILIDGAPAFLKRLTYAQIQTTEITEKAMEILLLLVIIKNIFVTDVPETITAVKLSECETWEERLDTLLNIAKLQHIYSEQYLRTMTNAMYNRLKSVFKVDTENVTKIKSSITLVRPIDVSLVDIHEDYELSRYTEGRVNVKFIEGNHTSMLENEMLVNLINECCTTGLTSVSDEK